VDLTIRQCPKVLYVMAYKAQILSLDLSAENADNFRNASIEKSGEIAFLTIF